MQTPVSRLQANKVWVIVYRRHTAGFELLALKPHQEDGLHYDYYVITGGIEENESAIDAAKREIIEEIGITPLRINELNEVITYVDRNTATNYVEECFAAEISDSKLVLNEEHVGYAWMSLHEFKSSIWWEGEHKKLEKILHNLENVISPTVRD